jgi:homoserine kinase
MVESVILLYLLISAIPFFLILWAIFTLANISHNTRQSRKVLEAMYKEGKRYEI